MIRYRSLGSPKSFLWYTPPLSRASILYFHIPSFFRAHRGEWLQGVAARWQVFFFFPEFLQGGSHWKAAITEGCDILVYWYGRKYPISQLEIGKKEIKLYLSTKVHQSLTFFHLQEFLKIVILILTVCLYMICLPFILQAFSIIVVKGCVVFWMHIHSL